MSRQACDGKLLDLEDSAMFAIFSYFKANKDHYFPKAVMDKQIISLLQGAQQKHPRAFIEAAIQSQSMDTTISQYFQPGVLQMGEAFMGDLENPAFAVLMCTGIITSYQ